MLLIVASRWEIGAVVRKEQNWCAVQIAIAIILKAIRWWFTLQKYLLLWKALSTHRTENALSSEIPLTALLDIGLMVAAGGGRWRQGSNVLYATLGSWPPNYSHCCISQHPQHRDGSTQPQQHATTQLPPHHRRHRSRDTWHVTQSQDWHLRG